MAGNSRAPASRVAGPCGFTRPRPHNGTTPDPLSAPRIQAERSAFLSLFRREKSYYRSAQKLRGEQQIRRRRILGYFRNVLDDTTVAARDEVVADHLHDAPAIGPELHMRRDAESQRLA